MKQFFTLFGCLIFISSYAQRNDVWWFDAGIKAQYGYTGMINQNISDSGDYAYEVGNGLAYGGKIGINYGYTGLALEAMFRSSTAVYEDKTGASITNIDVDYSSVDVYALFRTSKNLGYFEIGPKVSLWSEVDRSGEGLASPVSVTDNYNSTNFAGVLGFGAYVIGSDGAFSGILGLRFEYGFTDVVSDSGATLGAPVGNVNLNLDGASSTNPVFAGIVFELNWGIGYFGQAACGERSKLMRF